MSAGADYTSDRPHQEAEAKGEVIANSRGIYKFWLEDLEHAKKDMRRARARLREAQARVAEAKAWADADDEYEAAWEEHLATRLDINAPSWSVEQVKRARDAELRLAAANKTLDDLMNADIERKSLEQKRNAKKAKETRR